MLAGWVVTKSPGVKQPIKASYHCIHFVLISIMVLLKLILLWVILGLRSGFIRAILFLK